MTIWPQVITTALMAGGAAALAVPTARKALLGSVDQDWLQGELNLDCIEPDGVTVRIKDGTFCRIWQFRGMSYDAKVGPEQRTLLLGRTTLMRERNPHRPLVIAADDDHAKRHNAGVTQGTKAAAAVQAQLVTPPLTQSEKARGLTDFNDIMVSRGPGALKAYLDSVLRQPGRQRQQEKGHERAPRTPGNALARGG